MVLPPTQPAPLKQLAKPASDQAALMWVKTECGLPVRLMLINIGVVIGPWTSRSSEQRGIMKHKLAVLAAFALGTFSLWAK